MVQLVKRVEAWRAWLQSILMLQRLRGDPTVVREVTYPAEDGTFYKDGNGSFYMHAQSGADEQLFIIGVSMPECDELESATFIVGDSPRCLYHALQMPLYGFVPPRQNFALRVEHVTLTTGVVRFHGWSVTEAELKAMRKASL